jgi:hypothetical protein
VRFLLDLLIYFLLVVVHNHLELRLLRHHLHPVLTHLFSFDLTLRLLVILFLFFLLRCFLLLLRLLLLLLFDLINHTHDVRVGLLGYLLDRCLLAGTVVRSVLGQRLRK